MPYLSTSQCWRAAVTHQVFARTHRSSLLYAFNFPQAIQSFVAAQKYGQDDGDVALCYWGEAFATGQNLNAGMPATRLPQAMEALRHAMQHLPAPKAAAPSVVTVAHTPPVGTGWGLPTTVSTTVAPLN